MLKVYALALLCFTVGLTALAEDTSAALYRQAFETLEETGHSEKLRNFQLHYLGDLDVEEWAWLGEDHGVVPLLEQATAMERPVFVDETRITPSMKLPFLAKVRRLGLYLAARSAFAFAQEDYQRCRELLLLNAAVEGHMKAQPFEITYMSGVAVEGYSTWVWKQFVLAPPAEQAKAQTAVRRVQETRPELASHYDRAWRAMFPALKTIMGEKIQGLGNLWADRPVDEEDEDAAALKVLKEIKLDEAVVREALFSTMERSYERVVEAANASTVPAADTVLEEQPDPTDMVTAIERYSDLMASFLEPLSEESVAAIRAGKQPAKAELEAMSARLSEWTGRNTGLFLMDMIVPMTSYLIEKDFEARLRYDFVALHLALGLYKAEHGAFPERLEALVPTYLDAVPQDLFTADLEPLRYERTDDGYRFYSVGKNLKDDGGKDQSHGRDHSDIVERFSDYPRTKAKPKPSAAPEDGGIFFSAPAE